MLIKRLVTTTLLLSGVLTAAELADFSDTSAWELRGPSSEYMRLEGSGGAAGEGRVIFRFRSPGAKDEGFLLLLKAPVAVPADADFLHCSVYSSMGGHRIYFRFAGSGNENYLFTGKDKHNFFTLAPASAQRFVIDLRDGYFVGWGGASPKKLNFPLKFVGIQIDEHNPASPEGEMTISPIGLGKPDSTGEELKKTSVKGGEAVLAQPRVEISSGRTGNLTFDRTPMVFSVRFENRGSFSGTTRLFTHLYDFLGREIVEPKKRDVTLAHDSVIQEEIGVPEDFCGGVRLVFCLEQNGKIIYSAEEAGGRFTPVEQRMDSPLGVYVWTFSDVRKDFEILRLMGFSRVRSDMVWSYVEKNAGTYHWNHYDQVVAEARKNNMQLMLNLQYTPKWAIGKYRHLYGGDPADNRTLVEFAAAAAKRYPDVRCWLLWNEPDVDCHWGGGAEGFAELLRQTHASVKAANPQALLSAGGVTGLEATSRPFVEKLLELKADRWSDLYCFHYGSADRHLAMLAAAGVRKEVWNVEESNSFQKNCPELLVRNLIRNHLKGVGTILFLFRIISRGENFDNSIIVKPDYTPTALFPIYRNLSLMLGGRKFVRERNDFSPFSCFEYAGEHDSMLILWKEGEEAANCGVVSESSQLRVCDMYGDSWVLKTSGMPASFPAGKVTCILLDPGAASRTTLAVERLVLKTDVSARAMTGCLHPFNLIVRNPEPHRFTGRLRWDGGEAWETPAEQEITLEPGAEITLKPFVRLPVGNPSSFWRLTARLFDAENNCVAISVADLKLQSPVSLELVPVILAGACSVQCKITNFSDKPFDGIVKFKCPIAWNCDRNISVRLEPGKTVAVDCPLPNIRPGNEAAYLFDVELETPERVVRCSRELDFLAVVPQKTDLFSKFPSILLDLPIKLETLSCYDNDARGILTAWMGPDDLSVRAALSWDPQYLYVQAYVRDDFHCQPGLVQRLWQADSLQCVLDGTCYDLALTADGAIIESGGRRLKNIPVRIARDGAVTRYLVGFPPPAEKKNWKIGDCVRLAFCVNDADREGRRKGWLYYLNNIGHPANRDKIPLLTFSK